MEGDQLHPQHRLSGLGKIWEEEDKNNLIHVTAAGDSCVFIKSHCKWLHLHGCVVYQALYDHLMDFLADRGVDNTFADELMELSTAVEHQEYIKFLEDLQGFVKCN